MKLKSSFFGLYRNKIIKEDVPKKMDVKRKTVAQIKNVKEFVNKPVSETTADTYLPRSVPGVQQLHEQPNGLQSPRCFEPREVFTIKQLFLTQDKNKLYILKYTVIPVNISGNMSNLAWDELQIFRSEAENYQKNVCIRNIFSTID